MLWNWQRPDWPNFSYDKEILAPLEARFLLQSGEFTGAFRHVDQNDRDLLKIELIGDEALKTSEIEGEILDRDSVQSSLRQQFGLASDRRRVRPAERGIAAMMVALYESFADRLTHETMFTWHDMIVGGYRGTRSVAGYRTHTDPMQVISGSVDHPRVHFEAPPSDRVRAEMELFVGWFNETAPDGKRALPALERAGIAHLYFVCIHPLEDGNGRVGRALAEKSLAQNFGQPSLIALAYTIERERNTYYGMVESNNKDTEITEWLAYFAETVLEAQRNTLARVDFHVAKARLYDGLRGRMNPRQDKVIARMFREGTDGFRGGLSAENYISITNTSRATATRDLQDLVAKGALIKTGELRYTRYHLNLAAQRQ